MTHHCHHHDLEKSKNLSLAFWLNITFAVIEIFGALLTNSVAILADAVHDFGDSFSLGLAWYFSKISQKKSSQTFSYGFKRFSLLAALINGIVLIGGSAVVLFQAVPRFFHPEPVHAPGMIGFAITAYVLPPRMDLTDLFPGLDDSSLIFGKGMDDNVRLGHVGMVEPQQVLERLAPAVLLPQAACFQNGICLKAVSYHRKQLAPGEPFALDLHWTVQNPVADDFIMFVHLLDGDGKSVAGVNAYPLEHAYRTYEWQPGETIISSTELDVRAACGPGLTVLSGECICRTILSACKRLVQIRQSTANEFFSDR